MDIKKFMSLSDEDMGEIFNRPVGCCAYSQCGKEVRGLDQYRKVPAGIYHEDCYWNEIGEEVERNPIHHPRKVGGCY